MRSNKGGKVPRDIKSLYKLPLRKFFAPAARSNKGGGVPRNYTDTPDVAQIPLLGFSRCVFEILDNFSKSATGIFVISLWLSETGLLKIFDIFYLIEMWPYYFDWGGFEAIFLFRLFMVW